MKKTSKRKTFNQFFYKAVLKSTAGRRHDYTNCRLIISVGQEYHKGEKFRAAVDWALKRYQHIEILVGDLVHRYNIELTDNLSSEDALEEAKKRGSEWIQENKDHLERIPDLKLVRWEDVLQNVLFEDRKKMFESLYENSRKYRNYIQEIILSFWNRQVRNKAVVVSNSSWNRFNENSRKFLIEESAVFSIIFSQRPAVDIYPGGGTLMRDFKGMNIQEPLSYLSRGAYVQIGFRKKDKPHPN